MIHVRLQDCGVSLADENYNKNYQSQQQQKLSACYPLDNRLLCLDCHIRRRSSPAMTTVASSSSFGSTCWPGCHDNDVTWPPMGVASPPFVDVTLDGDTSSTCTSCDEVISNPGSDVTESATNQKPDDAEGAAPVGGNSVWSVDSGHCSGASDDTVTSSSDTETLDAGSEDDDDDDDDDDVGSRMASSDTLVRRSSSISSSTVVDSVSILELLADSGRVTDL